MDDLVIRAVPGDLAIRDGRIVAITPRHCGTARRVLDAEGSIVAPGFIARSSRA